MKRLFSLTSFALMRLSFNSFFAARFQLLGRLFFYLLTVLIFSQLWTAALSINSDISYLSIGDMIWYITLTESAILSEPYLYSKIEADIKSGDIAYFLLRPLPYLTLRFSEALGTFLINFPFFLIVGIIMATFLSGKMMAFSGFFVLSLLFCVVSCVLSLLIQMIIGLCAFWLEDVSSIGLIYRKLLYLLGGLLLPLSMYPTVLQKLAYATPFPWMIYHRAALIYTHNLEEAFTTCCMLGVWILFACLILKVAFSICLKRIAVNGG